MLLAGVCWGLWGTGYEQRVSRGEQVMGDRKKEVEMGGMVLRVWPLSWGSREWGSSGHPGSEEQGCLRQESTQLLCSWDSFGARPPESYISSLNEQRPQLSGRGGNGMQCM